MWFIVTEVDVEARICSGSSPGDKSADIETCITRVVLKRVKFQRIFRHS